MVFSELAKLAFSQHTIKACNVHVGTNKNKILIILYSSKTHDKESKPQEIRISADADNSHNISHQHFSPFSLARLYMTMRGGYTELSEPFFIFKDGSHVKPSHVRQVLSKLLKSINLNPNLYSTHSLRSRQSCDLLHFGYTVEQIKKIGRWRSNAIYKYLK